MEHTYSSSQRLCYIMFFSIIQMAPQTPKKGKSDRPSRLTDAPFRHAKRRRMVLSSPGVGDADDGSPLLRKATRQARISSGCGDAGHQHFAEDENVEFYLTPTTTSELNFFIFEQKNLKKLYAASFFLSASRFDYYFFGGRKKSAGAPFFRYENKKGGAWLRLAYPPGGKKLLHRVCWKKMTHSIFLVLFCFSTSDIFSVDGACNRVFNSSQIIDDSVYFLQTKKRENCVKIFFKNVRIFCRMKKIDQKKRVFFQQQQQQLIFLCRAKKFFRFLKQKFLFFPACTGSRCWGFFLFS